MRAVFNYVKSNLIYPECNEIEDTYVVVVTRKADGDRWPDAILAEGLIKVLQL